MSLPVISPRPKTIEQLRQIQRELYELSQPFVRAKCDVLALSIPTFTIYPGGRFETKYDNWTTALLAYYDALAREARDSYLARNGINTENV